jgi:hypothetical protein
MNYTIIIARSGREVSGRAVSLFKILCAMDFGV